jgi:hypothetical protein
MADNARLKARVLEVLNRDPLPAKALEGGNRLATFKALIARIMSGEMSIATAYRQAEVDLPRQQSLHSASNRVFPSGWGERLVRTQISRFYNQAVLELVVEDGITSVDVPHSSEEDSSSDCTRLLAGGRHDAKQLLDRLIRAYAQGDFSARDPMIPHHPHCTHVVVPA